MLQRRNHRQIAQALDLTTHTVQNHMVQIWDRLCEPRNTWYALYILSTLYEEHGAEVGRCIPFSHLDVGQRFQYQGQPFNKIDRSKDRAGAYNAVSATGDRGLFHSRILVEVVNE